MTVREASAEDGVAALVVETNTATGGSPAIDVVPIDSPPPPRRPSKRESRNEALPGRARAGRRDNDESPVRAIVPYDPLQAYLNDIRKYRPLSREEENLYAVRYFTQRDKEAAYQLVVGNLWLVVRIARNYEDAARNLLDLIQEGNVGLMEAVKNYNPFREVRFPSYAVWWIKAYIIRYLMANWRLVKIGTTQAQRKLFFNLKKEKERLEREGFSPGPKLIAERLSVREADVVEMEQRMGAADVSVDAPLSPTEPESSLHTVLSSEEPNAEDTVARRQRQRLTSELLDSFSRTLKKKELIVLQRRLLTDSEDKATLQDISDEIHVSRERVRQIENEVKKKLQKFIVERLGTEVDVLW